MDSLSFSYLTSLWVGTICLFFGDRNFQNFIFWSWWPWSFLPTFCYIYKQQLLKCAGNAGGCFWLYNTLARLCPLLAIRCVQPIILCEMKSMYNGKQRNNNNLNRFERNRCQVERGWTRKGKKIGENVICISWHETYSTKGSSVLWK